MKQFSKADLPLGADSWEMGTPAESQGGNFYFYFFLYDVNGSELYQGKYLSSSLSGANQEYSRLKKIFESGCTGLADTRTERWINEERHNE